MSKRYPLIVLLIYSIFFVISFITNILGPLVPDIIDGFDLSLAMAGFLPFSFFVAYGVMSIPAGILLERFRGKPVMIGAFCLAFLGSLLFATTPTYAVALSSLFLIGIGMTMLQVAINPLLRAAGGEEHFAFNSVLGQLVFGSASFLSPFVYSWLVTGLAQEGNKGSIVLNTLAPLVPADLPWVSLYWVFALVTLGMVVLLFVVRLPRFELADDERVGAWSTLRELTRKPAVIAYFFGIFCYVGAEQGIANWISQFLATYHGFDPQVEGARVVALFWGLLTAGCLLGLLLLKLMDCRKVLVGFSTAAIIALTVALFGSAQVSFIAFMLCGFFLSVMWSVIFSLALNSVDRHHGSFSGILCTGIIGGAIISLLVGTLGEHFGLRTGMMIVYLALGYILTIGLRAKPIVDNATMSVGDLMRSLTGRERA